MSGPYVYCFQGRWYVSRDSQLIALAKDVKTRAEALAAAQEEKPA